MTFMFLQQNRHFLGTFCQRMIGTRIDFLSSLSLKTITRDFYELIHNLRFCFYISLELAFVGSNDKPGGLTDLNTADCNSVVGTEGGDIVYANLNPDIHVS